MKKNIKRLLENEKYLNRILEWYQEYVDIFGEAAFDDLKNDISKYIREDEVYYDDFYEYAMSNYLPKNEMDDVVVGTHKKIIDNQNENQILGQHSGIGHSCIVFCDLLFIAHDTQRIVIFETTLDTRLQGVRLVLCRRRGCNQKHCKRIY